MTRAQILGLSTFGVAAIGVLDELRGYELSLSLLYLPPVALADWYVGRGAGVTVAAWRAWLDGRRVECRQTIPDHRTRPWNTFVRFGFFVVTVLLLSALRASQNELRRLARTDSLTGLWSRQGFEDRLEHDLALSLRRATPSRWSISMWTTSSRSTTGSVTPPATTSCARSGRCFGPRFDRPTARPGWVATSSLSFCPKRMQAVQGSWSENWQANSRRQWLTARKAPVAALAS